VVVAEKELDLYWHDARLGVEVDAFSTHGSAAAFEDDHKVDTDMEAADIRIVRFTGRRIRSQPEAVIAKLAAILALRLGGLPPPRRR
jgi:very-short-patch-repair endonuclease